MKLSLLKRDNVQDTEKVEKTTSTRSGLRVRTGVKAGPVSTASMLYSL